MPQSFPFLTCELKTLIKGRAFLGIANLLAFPAGSDGVTGHVVPSWLELSLDLSILNCHAFTPVTESILAT